MRFCLVLLGKVMKSCWRPHLETSVLTRHFGVFFFLGTLLDKDLRWSDRILLGHVEDGRVIHALSASKRRVSLDGDVVLGAGGSDILLGVEGVDLDLVDDRRDSWVRRHQFFDLEDVRNMTCSRILELTCAEP